jgi:hypothetical protein
MTDLSYSLRNEGKVEGCYLIASLQGQRTYIEAGFEMVAERGGKRGYTRNIIIPTGSRYLC